MQFAQENGISEVDVKKAYNSFAVQTAMREADDLGRCYSIDAVPTFITVGRYETDMAQARGETNLFQLINDLVASERD